MKGRMDILNFKKQPSSDTEIKHFTMEADSYKNIVKIESDEKDEKENCEDISDTSDLFIDSNHRNSTENLNQLKEELSEHEGTDPEEDIDLNLPVLSVILKEEDSVNNHSSDYNEIVPVTKSRSEVEIKYEDDIEEEEYDSDEDSVSLGQAEMPELTNFHEEKSNSICSGSSLNKPNLEMNQTESISSHSCFNSNYFESSILNFQIGAHMQNTDVGNGLTNGISDDQGDKSIEKASDSVLLSIVYATINVPFSQVSKFLTAYNLSKSQLSIIRKVRRQVKNRLYAQNCRRRRVAHIRNLANELKQIKTEKEKLINQRGDLTAKKMSLQCRYKQLCNHVMHVLTERYRNHCLQLTDRNMNLSDNSQIHIQKRKLTEERDQIEAKKRKIETKYDDLYKHIFNVITARNHNNGMSKNVLDSDSIDFKLCNMNIVNELAMLNKYWTKNNTTANESIDIESSVSVDGSRTSENKLNDFVDYESSISVDDSPSGENTLNDFIDYESSMDESVINEQSDNITKVDSMSEDKVDEISDLIIAEKNDGTNNDNTITWNENSDDEEDSADEEDLELDEMEEEQEELKYRKKSLEEQYEKLYSFVFQALQVNETDFLKMYMDYCLKLLKVSGSDLCSIAFNGG